MSPALRTGLLVVGGFVIVATLVLGVGRVVERQRTVREINDLREALYRSRVAADRCRSALQTSEASLRGLGLTIDSLRTVVDGYESDDYASVEGPGVPARLYEEYLVVFEAYNDSVAVWEGRERRLRSAEAACRETILEHNALSDSLQAVLEAAGITTS